MTNIKRKEIKTVVMAGLKKRRAREARFKAIGLAAVITGTDFPGYIAVAVLFYRATSFYPDSR